MGNEMGNNNTSGLREEDNIIEDKSMQKIDHADDLKVKDHAVPATLDMDSLEKETEHEEKDNLITEGKISPEDASQTDYKKEQNHEAIASEDLYVNEKEGDSDMILIDKENIMQESGHAEEAKEQDILVPTAEDKNTQENEMELASLEQDGLASSRIEDRKCDEKEQDNSTVLEVDEIPLKGGAGIDEPNGEARLVLAGGDESTHGNKTGLVFDDRDGMEHPCVDKHNHDEKALKGAEEDIIINDEAKEQSSQEAASAYVLDIQGQLLAVVEDKITDRNEADLVSSDPKGIANLTSHNPIYLENEEDNNMIPVGKETSRQEAGYIEEAKGQDHLVHAAKDKNNRGNETEPTSLEHAGLASPHIEHYEKEQDTEKDDDMIPVDTEKSTQEAGYAEEAKGQDHLVPVAEDKNNRGNEMESASLEHDSLVSPRIEDREHDEKEEDTSRDEISLNECASTDETNAGVHLVPAGGDGSTHGTETGMVSGDQDGMECVDKLKHDNKEEGITINNEAEKQSSEEAASTDIIDIQGQLLAVTEDRTTNRNETGLVSSDPERTADLHGDNPKEHKKEVNNTNAETQENPLAKDYHEDDIEEKNPTFPADEGAAYNITKVEPAAGLEGDTLDNQILEGKEQGKTEPDAPAESAEVDAKPSEVVKGSDTPPASSSKNSDNQEVQKETNSEENLSERSHDFENQNSMKEEDKGTTNSISDAASSTSDDFVPREPIIVEHELAEIRSEQLVLENNGPPKSEDVIIPSSTCRDQENGFVLSQEGTSVKKESENGNGKQSQSEDESIEKPNGQWSEEGLKANDQNGFSSQFLQAKILENGHLVDATINHQKEQQKGSQQQLQLVTDYTFSMGQRNKEEPEEKKIIEEMVQNKNDSNPTENDTPRRENGEQTSLPRPHDPMEQAEAFLIPSSFLQALHDKQMHENDLESKKVENSDEYSIAEVKQESSTEFPIAEASFVNKNSTEKFVVANGDYTQRETVGRLSIESSPDNTTINAQMRKSPSFDLDLRIDARSEEHSDQTPLLYQDKATIASFSSQGGEKTSQYESMEGQEKTVTLERSDSKSRTPFLGFLKEDEEADNHMLLNPKKQDNGSATKKVSVSAKDVTSVTTKGKVKRKPRTSLFGPCMCCATV